MLCLAMREAIPETGLLLRRVETSIEPYMRHLDQSGGAWPEGIGYWNYGMRYAFLYLMSHERATGREHPLLRRAATRQTLRFPLDFTPDGCAAGFGDVNRWTPLPFHFLAARRLRVGDVGERLREWLAREEAPQWLDNTWPPPRRPAGAAGPQPDPGRSLTTGGRTGWCCTRRAPPRRGTWPYAAARQPCRMRMPTSSASTMC
ncbi:MAG: hypothetical protein GX590_03935 [Lentisphaerae bacterium]|nr:hypothetical protein [Lentisphaerota bacterium]